MQRTMESAVSLVTVYGVKAFWTLVVTLTLFRLKSSSANRNGVGTHDIVAIIQQQKFVFGFQDENFTCPLLWRSAAPPKTKCDACHRYKDNNSQEEIFTSALYPESHASSTIADVNRRGC